MKLLKEFDDLESAEIIRTQLFQVGIVSHISIDSTSTTAALIPDRQVSLLIVDNSQHEDALNYLNNKHHAVTTGLSREETKMIQKKLKVGVNTSINKVLLPIAIIMLVFFILIFTQS